MADQWEGKCIQCQTTISYADRLAIRDASLGRPRSILCKKCEQLEKRGLKTTALSEILIHSSVADIGAPLGKLEFQKPIHLLKHHPSKFKRDEFAIQDKEIRALYDELRREDTPVVIAVAPTGSGKSTFLPYRLLVPDGWPGETFTAGRQIVITQPRRWATIGITGYVAGTLHGADVGINHEIGYRVSGDHACDWRNRMVYVTDGTLVNWIVRGELDRISLIIIDEAHERSLNIDIILGLLTNVLPQYPHLKMLIVSATINHEKFRRFFDARLPGNMRCGVVECSGTKPVGLKIHWRNPSCGVFPFKAGPLHEFGKEVWRHLADAIVRLVVEMDGPRQSGQRQLAPGDVLGFLHGAKPIEDACDHIQTRLRNEYPTLEQNTDIYPLYAAVDEKIQKKAKEDKPDPNRRRIVIASNAAETSLTIEGLVHVIDSGFIKQTEWNPILEQAPLLPLAHSQAGVRQRWGRVGRTQEGFAWSIYTREQFQQVFQKDTTPDIQRACLDDVILKAKRGGADRIGGEVFPWLDPPDNEEINRSEERLLRQGSIDESGDLTNAGVEAALSGGEDALFARIIADADQFGFAIEIATLLPFLQEGLGDLFPDDRDWDPEERRMIRSAQDRLRGSCTDDLELCLTIYQAWISLQKRDREDFARRNGLDQSVLNEIISERADLIRQLGAKKKELEDRDIDFAGLERLRILILRVFPEKLHKKINSAGSSDAEEARYEPVYPESSNPPLLGIGSASCLRSRPPEALIAIGSKYKLSRKDNEERALLMAPFIINIEPSIIDSVTNLSDLALADWFREHLPRPARGSEDDHRQKMHDALRRNFPPGTLVRCRVQSVSGGKIDVEVLNAEGWGGKKLDKVVSGGSRREKLADEKEQKFRFDHKDQPKSSLRVQSEEEEIIDLIDEMIQADTEKDSGRQKSQNTLFDTTQPSINFSVYGRLYQYGDVSPIKPGNILTAEVTHLTDRSAQPRVIVSTPPSIERFRAFKRHYHPGASIKVNVVGPTPVGSLQRGLQVREIVTGLDMIIPLEKITVFNEQALLDTIPVGVSINFWVETIDEHYQEVTLTGFPKLESYLQRYPTNDNDIVHTASVVSIDFSENNIYVLVVLDDSQPNDGLIIPAKIVLFRDRFEKDGVLNLPYRVDDTVHTSVRVRCDGKSRSQVSKLTYSETNALRGAEISITQDQQLSCTKRLSFVRYENLRKMAKTTDLENALMELFLSSNEIFGNRIFTDLEQRFPVGKIVKGTVRSTYAGGANLVLKDGVDGHVARDEITWWNPRTRVDQLVQEGDVCDVKVLNVSTNNQTVHLSLRMALASSKQDAIQKMYPLSKLVEGVVVRLQDFGAFVMLEPGLDGLIPLQGMRDFNKGNFVNAASDIVQVNDRVRVRVTDNKNEKISLNLIAKLGKASPVKTQSDPIIEKNPDQPKELLSWDDPIWPWTEGENAIQEKESSESPAPPTPIKHSPLEKRSNPTSWNLIWE